MSDQSKKYQFYSRGHNQTVTIKPPKIDRDSRGDRVELDGVIADFGPNGRYETDNAEYAEILRESVSFNVDFWEEGNLPEGQEPVADAIAKITKAAIAHDAAAIEEIIQNEKTHGNRPDVVGLAETALANVRKILESGVPRTEVEDEGSPEPEPSAPVPAQTEPENPETQTEPGSPAEPASPEAQVPEGTPES